MDINLWIHRFDHIDRKFIGEKIKYIPDELDDLQQLSPKTAGEKLANAFRDLFVPTEQVIDKVETLVDVTRGFSLVHYQDPKGFIKNCYDKKFRFGERFQILLTGFAGGGKSALLRALPRVFPEERSIKLQGHPEIPLVSLASYRILGSVGIGDILKDLLGEDNNTLGKGIKRLAEIIEKLVWKYHRCGAPLLTIDELQFIARGDNSNTKVTNLLGDLSSIGLPHIVAINWKRSRKASSVGASRSPTGY